MNRRSFFKFALAIVVTPVATLELLGKTSAVVKSVSPWWHSNLGTCAPFSHESLQRMYDHCQRNSFECGGWPVRVVSLDDMKKLYPKGEPWID